MLEHWQIQAGDDEAEAETLAGALLAADTLCREQAHAAGALRALRASVYICRDGIYAGTATELARSGHRAPLSDEWGAR